MANIKTGKPDTTQDSPAHVKGINKGGSPGDYAKQVGHNPDGSVTARAATGINPDAAGPIDPRMPNLPPA